ncbi:MAG: Gfo/Idh/MocA family protein, partial [Terriglobales bacterium]
MSEQERQKISDPPQSASPVRTALIGYGLAGSVFHAPLVHHTGGLALSAVVTANPARQADVLARYKGTEVFESADEIWKNASSYDLVVIATPNDTHAPLALTAMEKGLNVVVDKPFAISSQQAEELIAVRNKTGVALSVFQNRRWDADFLTLQELIRTKKVGTVMRLESRYERYRPVPKPGGWRETTAPELGGGLLFDLGSHLIDQAIVLFGKPLSVYAEVKTRRAGIPADDDTFIALQFENDVCAHLWVSLMAKVPGPRFRLMGTVGLFEKFGMDPQEDALRSGMFPGLPGWGYEMPELSGKLYTNIDGIEFSGIILSKTGAYEQFYHRMRDAVRGLAPVPVPAEDALTTLR